MKDYYSPKNTGGAVASRGFEYQDLCAIKYYLEYVDEDDFKSLTLEQTNDFSILFKDNREKIFQVKDYKLSKKELNDILDGITPSKTREFALIAPQWSNELSSILVKIQEYKSACGTPRSDAELARIYQALQNAIIAKGFSSNIMNCAFFLEPNYADHKEALLYKIHAWQKKHGYESDERLILSQLAESVAIQRCRRGSLNYFDLVHIAECSKISTASQFTAAEPSTYRETVLAGLKTLANENTYLRAPLTLVAAYIEGRNLQKALDELTELVKTFPKVKIYKAWILLELSQYNSAQKECDEILESPEDPSHSAALLFKGIIAYKQADYNNAYEYLREPGSLDSISVEQAEYLAKTEIALNIAPDEAQELLERCIRAGHVSSEIYYDLATLYPHYKSIEPLEEALILDANNLKARRLLAERYRLFGENSQANRHYMEYFSDPSTFSDWESLQGFVYCLISLGKTGQAEYYLLRFIDSFITNEGTKLDDQQTAVLLELCWNETNILTCTKADNYYKFCSPLGEYSTPVNRSKSMGNKDAIGVITDPLLYIQESIRCKEANEHINIENTWKPLLAANYDDDLAFLNKKNILIKDGIAHLNHDYETPDVGIYSQFCHGLKRDEKFHYQEYIVDETDVSIKIYEYAKHLHIHTRYKNGFEQTSSFPIGENYRNFRKTLNNCPWLSWYFYSVHRKELIDLCIPTKCVEIILC